MKLNQRSSPKTNSLFRKIGIIIAVSVICMIGLQFIRSFRFPAPTELPISEMKVFKIDQGQIEFVYPANWFGDLTPQGEHGDREVIAFLTAPALLFQNIIVARKHFDNDEINEVSEWGVSRIKERFVSYEITNSANYSSDHISGLVSEYIADSGSPLVNQNAHCEDLYILHKQQGYIFSFCANESDWPNVEPIFQEIMDSIQFLE